MMSIKPSIDPFKVNPTGPTCFMTERNGHEVRCGACGRSIYVDEESYRYGSDAINFEIDNPFLCENCVRTISPSTN
jgi:hypothetical protein